MSDAERAARRLARQSWASRVFRPGEEQAMSDADIDFWLQIPPDERAAVVWQLSVEAFALAGGEHERRLPRSDYRLVRR